VRTLESKAERTDKFVSRTERKKEKVGGKKLGRFDLKAGENLMSVPLEKGEKGEGTSPAKVKMWGRASANHKREQTT